MIRQLFTIIFIVSNTVVWAQPPNDACAIPTQLCSGVGFSGSNQGAGTDAADAATGCFPVNNSVWFTFMTNSTGGDASVTISNISCLTASGMDNELQAVILSAATACDPATYSEVSNCVNNGTTSITLTATGLAPNTTYYILVDGDSSGTGINAPAQCGFDVEVNGPAVEVNITATVTDQTCGNLDGQIDITAVSGATAPFQYSINNGAFQSSPTFSGLAAGTYVVEISDASSCVRIADTVVVNLLNGPQDAVANSTDATCNGNDGSLDITGVTGGTAPYTYSLNGGAPQAGTSFTSLAAGNYTVVVSDQQGCTQTIGANVANATGVTDATAQVSNASCGNADGSISVIANGGTAPLSYTLNGGAAQSSNQFSSLTPGIYTVLISDAGGCTYTLDGIVVAENPGDLAPSIVITASPNPACAGDNITVNATLENAGSNPVIEFFVNGTSVQSGAATSFSSSGLSSGDVISASLTSSEPCVAVTSVNSNSISMLVNPVSNPTVSISGSTATACQTDVVTYTATSSGCNGTPTYQWLVNGTPVASDTTGLFSSTFADDAAVSVNMTCSDPCATAATSNTENLDVTVVTANAGADQVIAPGQTAVLNGSGGGTYSWAPSSSLSSSNTATTFASPGASTIYTLTVTVNGCVDTDNVTVFVVEPIQVPNTFTPNGDGVNDTWQIYDIENFPNAKVSVYDRWGQRIFNTVGYQNSNAWDGTNKGMKLPAAVYYYVIDLNTGGGNEGDIYTGSITIVL